MEPYLDGVTVGPSSTTFVNNKAKMARSRNGKGSAAIAAPLAGAKTLGPRLPVTMTCTYRAGAVGWVQVDYGQGTVFVEWQAHIGDVLQKLIQGGHRVRPPRPRGHRG